MRINIEAVMTENNYSALEETPAARREIKLKEKDANLVRDMQEISQITAKKYYNIHRKEISFAIKNEIFINIKNLRVRKLCKKLTDRYIGLFKIFKTVDLNAYELKLPIAYKALYYTFSVFLLKPYSRKENEEPLNLLI